MTAPAGTSLRVVDSHTAGEPTRVVVDGGPDLGAVPLDAQRDRLRKHHDHVRRAVILEPRGSDALVGALLCRTPNEDCAAGVVFFNNVGYLGMCGHGAIGCRGHACPPGTGRTGGTEPRYARGHRRRETDGAERGDGRECRELLLASRCRRGRRRPGHGSRGRRLGRQLVLPRRASPGTARSRSRGGADGARRGGSRPRSQARVSPARTVPRSTTSSYSARPARTTRTAATSSCVRAMPTTARLAGPARVPSSPASPPGVHSLPAKRGCRRASSAATSRAGTAVPPTAASSQASAARRMSAPRRR